VAWYSSPGKRERRTFHDREKAESEADFQEAAIAKAFDSVTAMADDTRALAKFNYNLSLLPAGVTLDDVFKKYMEESKVEMNQSALTTTVCDSFTDSLEVQYKADSLSKRHWKTTASRLRPFKKAFGTKPIAAITSVMIDKYLTSYKASSSKKGHMLTLSGLFNFAKQKGFFPQDRINPASKEVLPRPKVKKKDDKVVYTPNQMTRLLAATPIKLISWMVLGAFAGVREEERKRLKWVNYNEEEHTLHLFSYVTKTNHSRTIELTPNIEAWLKLAIDAKIDPPRRKRKEMLVEQPDSSKDAKSNPKGLKPIVSYYNPMREKNRAVIASEVDWHHNGLRHSYVSYHCQAFQNLPLTSSNCGHSVEILKSKYQHLVTKKDAKDWFDITPEAVVAYCRENNKPMPEWASKSTVLAVAEQSA
jgi:integrase